MSGILTKVLKNNRKKREKMTSIKEDLIKYSKLLSEKNMVTGPGGNTSVRIENYMYIKPSGVSFIDMNDDDLVEVEISTGKVSPHVKGYKPSSEVLMHLYYSCVRRRVYSFLTLIYSPHNMI